jgi:hypothetical protein
MRILPKKLGSLGEISDFLQPNNRPLLIPLSYCLAAVRCRKTPNFPKSYRQHKDFLAEFPSETSHNA